MAMSFVTVLQLASPLWNAKCHISGPSCCHESGAAPCSGLVPEELQRNVTVRAGLQQLPGLPLMNEEGPEQTTLVCPKRFLK